MKKQPSGDPAGPFRWYLGFMAAACGGALLWQAFLPELAGLYSSWGVKSPCGMWALWPPSSAPCLGRTCAP